MSKFRAKIQPERETNKLVCDEIQAYLDKIGPYDSKSEAQFFAATLAGFGVYYTVEVYEVAP